MTNELLGRLDQGTARLFNAAIAEEAGRWFVSFCCEVERSDATARFPDEVVGVDFGVVHLATLSNGVIAENSKPLASTYGMVVIEDLNVAGMTASPRPRPDPSRPGHHLRNGKAAKAGLNRAILDTAPGEFRRQLTYKLAWRGGTLVVADRWFPSSKLCSSCGSVIAKLSKPDLFHPMNDRAIAGAGNCWRPAAGSARHFHVILSGSPSSRPSAMSDITSNVG